MLFVMYTKTYDLLISYQIPAWMLTAQRQNFFGGVGGGLLYHTHGLCGILASCFVGPRAVSSGPATVRTVA
ncbi:MAG: hypothetical protein A2Y77_05560 [Planctomycetes bacterium RBG_13_62_9]|nr:MAG: hypothetical protein A2Y77_05560 [Planctomycetes bacterium RBG_13_62_9]